MTQGSGGWRVTYHLMTDDLGVVERVLDTVDAQKNRLRILEYDVHGSSLDDVFRGLMQVGDGASSSTNTNKDTNNVPALSSTPIQPSRSTALTLRDSRQLGVLSQALVIFHKRLLILRRSWIAPLVMMVIPICASTLTLSQLKKRTVTCSVDIQPASPQELYLPNSDYFDFFPGKTIPVFDPIRQSPPNVVNLIAPSTSTLFKNLPNNQSFLDEIDDNYLNISVGGISTDLSAYNALIAYDIGFISNTAMLLLNLASNLLYNTALNNTGHTASPSIVIDASHSTFAFVDLDAFDTLFWLLFFGLGMVCHLVTPVIDSLFDERP